MVFKLWETSLIFTQDCVERHQIRLGKMYRPYEEWKICVVCGYDDLINHVCGADYYSMNLTICSECGVMVDWES